MKEWNVPEITELDVAKTECYDYGWNNNNDNQEELLSGGVAPVEDNSNDNGNNGGCGWSWGWGWGGYKKPGKRGGWR